MTDHSDKSSFAGRGSKVYVKDGENITSALRKFKRKVEAAGILEDLRKKEFYEKPTSVRKRKAGAAKARWKKKVAATKLPPKLY